MDAIFVVVVVVVVIVPCPWPPLAFWTNLTPLYMQYPYSNFSLKPPLLHLLPLKVWIKVWRPSSRYWRISQDHWFEIYMKKYIYFTEKLSLDIVHIQEYLGCVRSSKNRVETFVTKV